LLTNLKSGLLWGYENQQVQTHAIIVINGINRNYKRTPTYTSKNTETD